MSILTFILPGATRWLNSSAPPNWKKERFLESEEDQTIRQTQVLLEILETGPEFLEAFDEELFSELVAKIIVENNECLRFRLINGLELTETIERTVR